MKPLLKIFPPCMVVLFALTLCVTDAMAQGGNRGGKQRGGRNGGGEDNPQKLLRIEAVQRELELTEEQIKSLAGANDGRDRDRDDDREAREAEFEGLSEEEREERRREIRNARTNERTEQLSDILLPFQVDRLNQIAAQASARGGARALINGSLAQKLGITETQRSRIEVKAGELAEELDAKIAKLRNQMQEEILSELDPDQRAQYRTIMGEKFTFEEKQKDGKRNGKTEDRDGKREKGEGKTKDRKNQKDRGDGKEKKRNDEDA